MISLQFNWIISFYLILIETDSASLTYKLFDFTINIICLHDPNKNGCIKGFILSFPLFSIFLILYSVDVLQM